MKMATNSIALVDDQEITLINLGILLEKRLNVEVGIKARSGKEFLRRMKKKGQPDLVITDLAMPDMGGVTLCKKLKKLYPNLKILVLSVYNNESITDSLYEIGVDGFVKKDAMLDELIASVQQLLNADEKLMRVV